jgi:hypothetical protein
LAPGERILESGDLSLEITDGRQTLSSRGRKNVWEELFRRIFLCLRGNVSPA